MKNRKHQKKIGRNTGKAKESDSSGLSCNENGLSMAMDKCPEYLELLHHIGGILRDMAAAEMKGGFRDTQKI